MWSALRVMPQSDHPLHTPTKHKTLRNTVVAGRTLLYCLSMAPLASSSGPIPAFLWRRDGSQKTSYFVRVIDLHLSFYKITNRTSDHRCVQMKADLKTGNK